MFADPEVDEASGTLLQAIQTARSVIGPHASVVSESSGQDPKEAELVRAASQKKIHGLQAKLSRTQKERDDANEELAALRISLDTRITTIEPQMKVEKEKVQSQLAECRNFVGELEQRLQELNTNLGTQQQLNEQHVRRIEDLEKELVSTGLEEQLESYRAKIGEMTADAMRCEEVITTKNNDLRRIEEELSETRYKLQVAQETVASMDTLRTATDANASVLQSSVDSKGKMIERLQQELVERRQNLDIVLHQLSEKEKQIITLTDSHVVECERLECALSQLAKEHKVTLTAVANLNAEIAKAKTTNRDQAKQLQRQHTINKAFSSVAVNSMSEAMSDILLRSSWSKWMLLVQVGRKKRSEDMMGTLYEQIRTSQEEHNKTKIEMSNQLDELERACTLKTKQLEASHQASQAMDEKYKSVSIELTELLDENATTCDELESVKQVNETLSANNMVLKEALTASQDQFTQQQKENSVLQQSLNDSRHFNESLQEAMAAEDMKLKEARTTNETLQLVNDDLQNNLDNAQQQRSVLEREASTLRDEITELHETTKILEETKTRLQDDLSQLQQDKVTLQGESALLQDNNAQLQQDSAKLQGESAKFQEDSAKLHGSLEARMTQLQVENLSLKQQLAALQDEKGEVGEKKSSLEVSLGVRDDEISKLQCSLLEAEAKRQEQYVRSQADAKTKIEELEFKLLRTTEELDDSRQKHAELERKESDSQQMRDADASTMRGLNAELDSLRSDLEIQQAKHRDAVAEQSANFAENTDMLLRRVNLLESDNSTLLTKLRSAIQEKDEAVQSAMELTRSDTEVQYEQKLEDKSRVLEDKSRGLQEEVFNLRAELTRRVAEEQEKAKQFIDELTSNFAERERANEARRSLQHGDTIRHLLASLEAAHREEIAEVQPPQPESEPVQEKRSVSLDNFASALQRQQKFVVARRFYNVWQLFVEQRKRAALKMMSEQSVFKLTQKRNELKTIAEKALSQAKDARNALKRPPQKVNSSQTDFEPLKQRSASQTAGVMEAARVQITTITGDLRRAQAREGELVQQVVSLTSRNKELSDENGKLKALNTLRSPRKGTDTATTALAASRTAMIEGLDKLAKHREGESNPRIATFAQQLLSTTLTDDERYHYGISVPIPTTTRPKVVSEEKEITRK